MAKIKAERLSATDCEAPSEGTDQFTEGWWFRGTDEKTAKAFLAGRKIESPFWLTKNPNGASQRHGACAIRCTVLLNQEKHDRYRTKGADEGLDRGFAWLGLEEGRIFIDAIS